LTQDEKNQKRSLGAEEEGAAQKKLEERLTAINLGEREKEAQRIAEKSKLPYIDLSIAPIESQAVWLVPERKAKGGNLFSSPCKIQKTKRCWL